MSASPRGGARMGNLFAELKRRHIYRVAAAYAVVAWVLLQVVNNLAPALRIPDWGLACSGAARSRVSNCADFRVGARTRISIHGWHSELRDYEQIRLGADGRARRRD